MVPQTLQDQTHPPAESADIAPGSVSEECLVVRNYDGKTSHEVTVRFLDATDSIAFRTTHTLSPLGAITVSERIDRAVYRVEVAVDATQTGTAECLIGNHPTETALVEIGNGLLSISEGIA